MSSLLAAGRSAAYSCSYSSSSSSRTNAAVLRQDSRLRARHSPAETYKVCSITVCRAAAEPTSQATFTLSDVTVMPHFASAPASNSSHAGTTAAAQHLALHIGETTIQLPFSPAQAQQLDAELAKLLQTFSDKQAAKRPKRWDMMEVRFSGPEAGQGLELLELFCNPNAHATAFDAKLLVTVKAAGGLKVMSEGRLSAIKSDLDAYLATL